MGFRDIFETIIVNKPNLSQISKLGYLRMCIQGDAENMVKSFAISNENFDIVWKKLKSRYEVKRVLDSVTTPRTSF